MLFRSSCFFHHSRGRPDPEMLEVAPLLTLPMAGALGAVVVANLDTFQGSSVEYARAGIGMRMASWKLDVEGAIKSRSRVGSGRAFCWARAATRSTLRSTGRSSADQSLDTTMPATVPFPDCASAARARATKNSRRDTRGLELTRLTIYQANKFKISRRTHS